MEEYFKFYMGQKGTTQTKRKTLSHSYNTYNIVWEQESNHML